MTPETGDPPWWRGAVLYQVYPRSFQDADGDGVGDLAGLLARLPYIASLGVDGIWLSPVFASPMRDFGYDVSDYCAIDPLFGTLADFDAVVAGAHGSGLRLIVDQVWSHTSIDHPWFAESRGSSDGPKADWYVWAPARGDGSPPNNWQATFGGPAWTWDTGRRLYYLHNFLPTQPDLNLHHPQAQAAILAVARFWLDRGVDGFRLDVVNCFTHDPELRDNPAAADQPGALKPYFMQRHVFDRSRPETAPFVARVRALLDEQPGRLAVAELASEDPLADTAAYASGPHALHTAYNFRLLGPKFSAERLRETLRALAARAPDAWPSFAFSNHDFARVASRWGAGRPAALWPKTLIALLTALRGTAFLYQGEELGLPQAEVPRDALRDPDGVAGWPAHPGRDGCRTPMPWRAEAPNLGFTSGEPWLPAAPEHARLAVDLQDGDDASTLAFTRRWLAFRRTRPELKTGALELHEVDDADVLAFTREGRGPPLLLMFNCGLTDASGRPPPGAWREAFPLGGARQGGNVRLPVGAGWCAELGPPAAPSGTSLPSRRFDRT